MTVNEIVDELRASRPRASDALRLQVLAVASQPAAPRPSLLDRFRGPRRLVLALPVAAGLAVAAAIAVGVTRPQPAGREAAAPATTVERLAGTSSEAYAGPSADASAGAMKAAPAPTTDRAQRYSATLALGVDDTDALSDATQRARHRPRPRGLRRLRAVRDRHRGHVLAHAARPVRARRGRRRTPLDARHDPRPERPDPGPPGAARRDRPRAAAGSGAARRRHRPARAGRDRSRARAPHRAARVPPVAGAGGARQARWATRS